MIPNDIEERIEYVLHKFNFEKVSVTMNALDWNWIKLDGSGYEIPSIYRLKTTARKLMERAYTDLIKDDECKFYSTGTGGFCATCSEEDNKYYFVLQFVLTEYDSEDYD